VASFLLWDLVRQSKGAVLVPVFREENPSVRPVRVVSVPIEIPLVVRFLGPVMGLETHWKSSRTIPCPGVDTCPPALHRLGTIWRGYSAAESWDDAAHVWRPSVLEVTECLEETLRGRDLRGEVWALHTGFSVTAALSKSPQAAVKKENTRNTKM